MLQVTVGFVSATCQRGVGAVSSRDTASSTMSAVPLPLLERWRRRLFAQPLTTAIGAACAVLVARQILQYWRRDDEDEEEEQLGESNGKPEFALDGRENFHAFLFTDDAVCVAHGGDPSNVGKTLAQIFQNEEIEDASLLHERFMRVAAAGGGWCAYSWRSSPSAVRLKGAYIVSANVGNGRRGYAGVGYLLCPPESAGRALGLYGFVCTGEGKFVAHGGASSFVGSSLAKVVAETNNHLIDAGDLLHRFTTAARLGGGFVEYPWRNSPDAPLLTKGAHVMRVELGSGCTNAAAALQKHDECNWSGSYSNLAALAAAAETKVESTDWLATGGGRARTLFCGVGYFGGDAEKAEASDESAALRWRAAARASCLALKRKLADANTDEEVGAYLVDGEGVLAAAAAEALCREEPELPPSLAALLRPARTAAALGLYGAVIDASDGTYLAHGGSPDIVGSTLHAVMANVGMNGSDALLRRLRGAARQVPGGSWVRYSWRTSAQEPVHIKGAHCSMLCLQNPRRDAIALLCYGAPTSEAPPPGVLPKPPPVAPSRSAVKAAAFALRGRLVLADSDEAIAATVRDADGTLATAAAEALGWEVTELPRDTLDGVHMVPL